MDTLILTSAQIEQVPVLAGNVSPVWFRILIDLFVWKLFGNMKNDTQEPLVAVEPRRPPMTNVGTETAFRHDNCKHFQKSKHILGSEVSWCDHQPPEGAFSEVRVHAGTTQVDFQVDRPPPADSSPGDLLITMVKERVKKSFEKMKKSESCSHLSLIW